MRRTIRTLMMTATGAALAVALQCSPADARNMRIIEGFETGNAGGWTSNGDVRLFTGDRVAQPHGGKVYLALNAAATGSASITNLMRLTAAQGDACSIDLWARSLTKDGGLIITVKNNFVTGDTLAQRRIAMPIPSVKRERGYTPYRLNFRNGGAPLFVSIDAIAPAQVLIDDVSVTCRTK